MKWKKVREDHPQKWVLIEALEAYTQNEKRYLTDISVIGEFEDSEQAKKLYRKIHKKDPEQELYAVHTSNKKLEIEERKWLGIRL